MIREVKSTFDDAGVGIPFPQRTLGSRDGQPESADGIDGATPTESADPRDQSGAEPTD